MNKIIIKKILKYLIIVEHKIEEDEEKIRLLLCYKIIVIYMHILGIK